MEEVLTPGTKPVACSIMYPFPPRDQCPDEATYLAGKKQFHEWLINEWHVKSIQEGKKTLDEVPEWDREEVKSKLH
jgi:hypothetical protein